eukprot:SAG31_NODE_4949_length_2841_cov_1.665573_2_plen_210_part_00
MGKKNKDKGPSNADMEVVVVDNPVNDAPEAEGKKQSMKGKAKEMKAKRKEKKAEMQAQLAADWKSMDPTEKALKNIPIVIAKSDIDPDMDYGKNANLYPFFGCTFWCMLMFPLCHQDILCLDPKPKRENEKEGKAGCMSNCADKFAPKCCCARSIIDAKGGCCRHCFLRFYRCYLLSAVFSFGMTLIPFLLPFYIWPCEHCYARYCSGA